MAAGRVGGGRDASALASRVTHELWQNGVRRVRIDEVDQIAVAVGRSDAAHCGGGSERLDVELVEDAVFERTTVETRGQ